jgi:hypothetical protein
MAQAQREESAEPLLGAQSATRRPVDTARHCNVEIVIWRNTRSMGEFYSASAPSIKHRDEAGEFTDGSNFGRHDLHDLAEAAREAASKIRDLQKDQGRVR